VFLGIFTHNQLFPDLVVVLIFGGVGLIFDRLGYNKPAFILGFILGTMFEKYLFISLQAWGDLFFLKPGSLGLIIVIIAFLVFDPVKTWCGRRSKRGDSKA
jgi:TctA family transporter